MGTSLTGLLGIASGAMQAQTAALDVTGQNVGNVNTPGYVRRGVVLQTSTTGSGVVVQGTTRSYDQFTAARLVIENGYQGAASSRADALASLQSIVAPTTGGIGDAVNALFTSLQAVTANPSDPSARAAVLTAATTMANAFSGTAAGLAASRGDLLTKAQGITAEVNQKLAQVATLNQQIAEATANGTPAEDLEDQRDQLVSDLAQRVGARSVAGADGTITVYAGGTTLVSGGAASPLSIALDATGAMKIQAARPGGAPVDLTGSLTSGSLAGVREARDVDIPALQGQVDGLAQQLTASINSVHSTGFGLDGSTGRPLLQLGAGGGAYGMQLDPAMVGHPERLATAASLAEVPGGNGNAVALAQLGSQAILGASSPGAAAGAIGADVGVRKSAADAEVALREDTVAQAQAMNSSASGVSVDEEMVNLTKYQRAFEASAKVLQTTDQLLESLKDL